jgi:hypothetical protein
VSEYFKDLAQRAGEAFFASEARNYYGEVFTVDDGQDVYEIDITVRPVDKPSAHELRSKAEFDLENVKKKLYDLEHAVFHALDDSCDTEHGDYTILRMDFNRLCELVPEDWKHE